MAKHRYTYHGQDTVHLPLHGITAGGGDSKTVYETDIPVKNPDFEVVHETVQRKEHKEGK